MAGKQKEKKCFILEGKDPKLLERNLNSQPAHLATVGRKNSLAEPGSG